MQNKHSCMTFQVLAIGCNYIDCNKMSEIAQLYNHQISFSSLANQDFRKNYFHTFFISQKQKNYLDLLKAIKLESPRSSFVILVEDVASIQEAIESKELFCVLGNNSLENLEHIFHQMWRALLNINAQKHKWDCTDNLITIANGVLSLHKESYQKADMKYQLTRKQMDLLTMLLAHRGEVVSRITLIENIWNIEGKIVTDRVIDTNVVALRKMFGDNGRNPTYLQTIFGQGYRLTLE